MKQYVFSGWIGVDLDGTLAHYEGGPLLPIGKPVEKMVARVKRMIAVGVEVRVFTARISDPDRRTRARVVESIEAWCLEHIGQVLPVTNVKDFSMVRLYDDRAVQVRENTGETVGEDEFDVL